MEPLLVDGKHAMFPLWLLLVAASAQFLPFNDFLSFRFISEVRRCLPASNTVVVARLVPHLGILWGHLRHCIFALLVDGWRRLATGCPEVVRAATTQKPYRHRSGHLIIKFEVLVLCG